MSLSINASTLSKVDFLNYSGFLVPKIGEMHTFVCGGSA